MKAGEHFLNEALMDEEIVLVAERRKSQKVDGYGFACDGVCLFRLMRIGSSMF